MNITALAPWYGAKRRPMIRDRIIAELGSGHRGFCEGCAGSCAVTLSKPPTAMDIINDLNGDITNVARVLASKRWSELYDRCARTLLCSELYLECRERYEPEAAVAPSIDDVEEIHIEAAWRFLVVSWQGINGVAGTGRYNVQYARRFTVGGGHGGTRWKGVIGSLQAWHERLMNVLIDRIDVCLLIERLADDGSFALYLDPPYYRKGARYLHDFDAEKHAQLAAVCREKKRTRVVVSYYDETEVRALYDGWTVVECPMAKGLVNQGLRDRAGEETIMAPELLLINGESYTRRPGLFAEAVA